MNSGWGPTAVTTLDSIAIPHDELVTNLIDERGRADASQAATAFLASLSTRRLDWRSALGSYAFASRFPRHDIATTQGEPFPSGARPCLYCGWFECDPPHENDLARLKLERTKWGGARHDNPLYAWLDLSLFRRSNPVSARPEDRELLKRILDVAGSMPASAGPGQLEKALVGVLKSNKSERRVLIEILSLCGVLQPKDHSGYFGEFTFAFERERPHHHLNDWPYPAIWWTGADGVNPVAVAHYFPDL